MSISEKLTTSHTSETTETIRNSKNIGNLKKLQKLWLRFKLNKLETSSVETRGAGGIVENLAMLKTSGGGTGYRERLN
jgi:hypothetical protein